jgi:Asp-tRNA(Asn)/Glu-tRNA(Gln) amidotransferase A subunit family amidase
MLERELNDAGLAARIRHELSHFIWQRPRRPQCGRVAASVPRPAGPAPRSGTCRSGAHRGAQPHAERVLLQNTLGVEQQAVPDPDFRAQALLGSRLSALEVQRLHTRRGDLGSLMRQFMQRFDLPVTPTLALPAFDAKPAGHSTMDPQAMLGWTPFSYPFNLTQQPACTIPCGRTAAGLPIGLQIVGPMFGDALVLRAARAYETLRPIARPDVSRFGASP